MRVEPVCCGDSPTKLLLLFAFDLLLDFLFLDVLLRSPCFLLSSGLKVLRFVFQIRVDLRSFTAKSAFPCAYFLANSGYKRRMHSGQRPWVKLASERS